MRRVRVPEYVRTDHGGIDLRPLRRFLQDRPCTLPRQPVTPGRQENRWRATGNERGSATNEVGRQGFARQPPDRHDAFPAALAEQANRATLEVEFVEIESD